MGDTKTTNQTECIGNLNLFHMELDTKGKVEPFETTQSFPITSSCEKTILYCKQPVSKSDFNMFTNEQFDDTMWRSCDKSTFTIHHIQISQYNKYHIKHIELYYLCSICK